MTTTIMPVAWHACSATPTRRCWHARLRPRPCAAAVVAATTRQFGQLGKFPPVANVRVIADGQTVKLGELKLVAHATPGHTPGSTSWTGVPAKAGHCVDIAYVDSLTAISNKQYRYGEHPQHLAAFRHTIDTVASLRCDLLLTPAPNCQ